MTGSSTKPKSVLDLHYFIYNYGRFHNETINKTIHLFCIPTIAMGLAIIWPMSTTTTITVPDQIHDVIKPVFPYQELNLWLTIFHSVLCVTYLLVDPIIGFLTSAAFWTQAFFAYKWIGENTDVNANFIEGYTLWQFGLYIFVAGWIAQFIGHGVFEQRAPALLTNLLFAGLAPFFVTFEILNFFGYMAEDMKTI